MKNKMNVFLLPLLIFAGVTGIIQLARIPLQNAAIHISVLMGANAFLAVIHLLVAALQKRALANPNPNVFIRSVMSGMLIKMVAVALAVVLYNVLAGPVFSGKTVFVALFIYLLYLAGEVYTISVLNRRNA